MKKIYHIRGMHCASCEHLIEQKVSGLPQVTKANAILSKKLLVLEYKDDAPTVETLNKLFDDGRYEFSETPFVETTKTNWGKVILYAGLILFVFFIITQFKFDSFLRLNDKSSLAGFLMFGVLAGFSTCAALIGGLVIGLSKQWNESIGSDGSFVQRMRPHLAFNGGRFFSFTVAGLLLGLLGEKVQMSLTFSSVVTMVVSIIMIILGLQMLGVKSFQRIRIAMPKFLSGLAAREGARGRTAPFIEGALTIFLPCGFTLGAEAIAILSGNAARGGLIMFFFALGTSVALLLIGIASVNVLNKRAETFTKIAGIIVLVFAIYNINLQFTALDLPALHSVRSRPAATLSEQNGLPAVVDGKQLIQMSVGGTEYTPNYFKVKAGVPVRWEIDGTQALGCTSSLVARKLFPNRIQFSQTEITVKEFTPTTPGIYQFSCPMGMIVGRMEVVK